MKGHSLVTSPIDHEGTNLGIDVKSKILLMVILSGIILFIITFEQLIACYLLVILLGVVYQTNFKSVLTKSFISLPLVISLSLLTLFSRARPTTLVFGDLSITYSPMELAFFYFLRSELLVINALEVIESEGSFFDIIYGLSELGLPHFLTSVLLFMYRTTLDLELEALRMIDARNARSHGQKLGAALFSYRVIGYMVGAVFLRSLQHSRQRKDALISRGFAGQLPVRNIRFTARGATILWLSTILGLLVLMNASFRTLNIGR